MAHLITLFLLFGLPLLYLPGLHNPFEPPKVFVAQLFIVVLIVASIWNGSLKQKKWFSWPMIGIYILVLTGIINLFLAYSPLQLFGNIFRLQGFVLTIYLICFAFFSSRLKQTDIPPFVPFASLVLLFVSTLLIPPNQSHRHIGTLGEPNALAATAVILFPFILGNAPRRFINIFAFGMTLAILFLSGSRSGFIAFALELVFIYVWQYKKWNITRIILVCLFCLPISYVLPFTESKGLYENRGEIWQVGITAGIQHPIVGSGIGTTEQSMRAAAKKLASPIQYAYVDSAHNIFIDWFIQTGIVGLFAFCYLMYTAVQKHIHRQNIPALIAFIGFLAVASFNPLSVATLIFLWWFIGESTSAK